jgi:hypothetical protein
VGIDGCREGVAGMWGREERGVFCQRCRRDASQTAGRCWEQPGHRLPDELQAGQGYREVLCGRVNLHDDIPHLVRICRIEQWDDRGEPPASPRELTGEGGSEVFRAVMMCVS